jgi:hypothetical protein
MKKIVFLILIMMIFAMPVMADDTKVVAEAPAQAMGSVYQAEVDKAASEPGNEIVETDALNDLYFNEHE